MTMQNESRQLPITCRGHTRPVLSLDFSGVNGNYYYMVSASKDGFPMLRQGDTGDWIGTFNGHKGAIWDVKINELGAIVATAGADYSAKIWNALNGKEFYSFDHQHVVKSVDFDEKSEHLVTGGYEKVLRVFNLCNPFASPYVYNGHNGTVKSTMFCRNDKCLASIADDKTLRIWDTISGLEIQKVYFPNNPTSLTISADKSVLTTTEGKNVTFWQTDTLNKINEIALDVEVTSASLHPSKHIFVCGAQDYKIRKFDYQSAQELETHNGHFGTIHSVKFSPDGEIYASGSEDGTLKLWQNIVGKVYGKWEKIQSRNSNGNGYNHGTGNCNGNDRNGIGIGIGIGIGNGNGNGNSYNNSNGNGNGNGNGNVNGNGKDFSNSRSNNNRNANVKNSHHKNGNGNNNKTCNKGVPSHNSFRRKIRK